MILTSVRSQNLNNTKLMVIALDGFRWDYLARAKANGGFSKFVNTGSLANQLVPVYPSETYPNLYSILTGLYPENHGFVSKIMYDRTRAKIFYSYDGEDGEETYWWNQTDPIWITSTQQKKSTSVYAWPGCTVRIRDVRPYLCMRSNTDHETAIFEHNLQDALKRLTKNEIEFALVYSSYPGEIGLHFGPQSKEMNETINTIDNVLNQFLTSIINTSLVETLNVIILSDHGMTNYPTWNNSFSIFKLVMPDDIEFVTSFGTEVGVYPKAGKINKVYEELKKITFANVWKQQDIPEALHVKWHSRTPTILVAAKPGYAFVRIPNTDKQKPAALGVLEYKGIYGYDPSVVPEMNGIFLVIGPNFRKNVTIGNISVVDVYNMMTCVLSIEGHPNNGSWSRICPFLATECDGNCKSSTSSVYSTSNNMWLLTVLIAFFSTVPASPSLNFASI